MPKESRGLDDSEGLDSKVEERQLEMELCFLTLVSTGLLSVESKAIYFCVLSLYFVTLLNSLFMLRLWRLLVGWLVLDSLGFST